MGETITVPVHLPAFVPQDTRTRWIARCTALDVVSQGASEDDAKRCLEEAVTAWMESCIERGVLDEALREVKFGPQRILELKPLPYPNE